MNRRKILLDEFNRLAEETNMDLFEFKGFLYTHVLGYYFALWGHFLLMCFHLYLFRHLALVVVWHDLPIITFWSPF